MGADRFLTRAAVMRWIGEAIASPLPLHACEACGRAAACVAKWRWIEDSWGGLIECRGCGHCRWFFYPANSTWAATPEDFA